VILICCFVTTEIDQEEINKQLQAIFGIQTGYHGTVVSTFAKVRLKRDSNALYTT
jgi:hypothetical protein